MNNLHIAKRHHCLQIIFLDQLIETLKCKFGLLSVLLIDQVAVALVDVVLDQAANDSIFEWLVQYFQFISL